MNHSFWKLLTSYGTKVQVRKGIVIGGTEGTEASRCVYLLEDGICALTGFTKEGEEKVYLYFRPRRIICFNQLMVSKRPRNETRPEFSIITRTDCTLFRIEYEVFWNLIKHNPDFNAFLMETLADNYDEALVHFHLMQEESVTARLCRLLLEVAQTRGNAKVVPKFFTYAELAKYLGSHPVTVSRIMAKLKHYGYIIKTAYGLTIEQEDSLRDLINSETCFKY